MGSWRSSLGMVTKAEMDATLSMATANSHFGKLDARK